MKQPKWPSVNEWIKTVAHLHNGILCSREKEGAPTLCDNMDGTGEHYAKWNKPGSERQIPYDLTFNWNIINRGKKQQNITRDIEIKNNLTVAGEGTVGRRVFRNYYKGHRTKPRGRVEAREGGGFDWGGKMERKCRQL